MLIQQLEERDEETKTGSVEHTDKKDSLWGGRMQSSKVHHPTRSHVVRSISDFLKFDQSHGFLSRIFSNPFLRQKILKHIVIGFKLKVLQSNVFWIDPLKLNLTLTSCVETKRLLPKTFHFIMTKKN